MSLTRPLFVVAIVSVVATAAFAQKPVTPSGARAVTGTRPQGVGSSKEIMEALTIPLSDAVFAAGSKPPENDAQWLTVERQALALAESANLLLIPPRLITSGSWVKWSVAQRDAARMLSPAAMA